jgi:DNA-binding transcriptional LysR family regulator
MLRIARSAPDLPGERLTDAVRWALDGQDVTASREVPSPMRELVVVVRIAAGGGMMDLLSKMSTFVRVIEAGSIAAGARQLGLSAPAVSRQISTLEEQVRTPLLVRTTRRMTLTEAGQRYYDRCLRILREVEDAQAIGDPGIVRGTLTVSAPVTLGIACVAPHVPALLAAHPALNVDLRLEDRVVDLVAEAVDVAIRTSPPPPVSHAIIAHALMSYPRVLVGSPTYLRRRGEPKRPEDLSEHDAVSESRNGDGRVTWRLRRSGRERRVQPVVRIRCNARYAVRDAALRHVGLALLPKWLVQDDVKRGRLRIVLPRWESERTQVSALHRVELRGTSRVQIFLEHLRKEWARVHA